MDLAQTHFKKGVKKGDKTYVLFALKTLGKNEGFSERHEVTGPNGGPVQSAPDLSGYTTKELEAMRAIHEKARARKMQSTP